MVSRQTEMKNENERLIDLSSGADENLCFEKLFTAGGSIREFLYRVFYRGWGRENGADRGTNTRTIGPRCTVKGYQKLK